jgi:alpha-beta hydrolase superfamily lysophospholipase
LAKDTARRGIRWRRWLAIALLVAVLGLNGVAWMQARAMTHYAANGTRTPKPEELSFAGKIGTIFTGVTVTRPRNEHSPADVGLRYETRSIPVGQAGGTLEAWYVPSDAPRGIVLMFSGYAESKDSLLSVAAAFHDMGYDALMVDFRGVGGSSGDDTTLGVRESEDVNVSLAYAQKEWPGRRTILYGVSMGAAALLRAVAIGGANPDAIIVESPFDRLLSTVGNRFNAMGLPAFPTSELLVFWGSVQQGSNGFANNPVEYARSVRCPTLLMHGEQDPRVTVEQSRAIYDALGGYKEQVEFRGAGHQSLIATAPQLWKDSAEHFLRHVEGQ